MDAGESHAFLNFGAVNFNESLARHLLREPCKILTLELAIEAALKIFLELGNGNERVFRSFVAYRTSYFLLNRRQYSQCLYFTLFSCTICTDDSLGTRIWLCSKKSKRKTSEARQYRWR
jgi:hypothetical protein